MRRAFRTSAALPVSAILLAGLALLAGCQGESETPGPELVLVEGSLPAVDPGARIGPSSRLLLGSFEGNRLVTRELEPDLIAGSPIVGWDGTEILFVGRRRSGDPLSLWSATLPNGRVETLDTGSLEIGSADLLPDGRIVVSARVEGPPPTSDLESRWALFVIDRSSGDVQRITRGLSELDPSVLADGRIVYAGWQPGGDGRPEEGAFALFTVHPDGTGVTAFHGFHDGPRLKLAPRTLTDGDVVYLAGDAADDLRALRIDRRNPYAEAREVGGASGAAARSATRWSNGGVVVLTADGRIGGSADDGPGAVAEGITALAATTPRPRPQGHLTMVDPAGTRGRVFGVDGRPAGREDEAAGLRIRSRAPDGSERLLGQVELEEDGSFFLDLPADVALYFDVVDADGDPIEVSTTPIWLRPNEKRGCVGCHESPGTAPPNRRPLAVLSDPVALDFEGTS